MRKPDRLSATRVKDIQRGALSFQYALLIVLGAATAVVALYGWRIFYSRWLEPSPPVISVIETPRGVGVTPVSLRVSLNDASSGLSEVVVSAHQRGVVTELLRRGLAGARSAQVTVEIPAQKSVLEDGLAELEVQAFDRSLWRSSSRKRIGLQVDYRKPRISVVSTQHNTAQGGSQLIFYNAYDENLAISGVKVGNQTYLGYPARGIDESFTDPALYVAIYAIDPDQNLESISVRAFAEDQVGNATSIGFNNKVRRREWRNVSQEVTEDFLRDRTGELLRVNQGKLGNAVSAAHKSGAEGLIDNFRTVNESLRRINDTEITALLSTAHFKRYFEGAFAQPAGTLRSLFGDNTSFSWDGRVLGKIRRHGYEFSPSADDADVYAASGGIVLFAENIGVYGNCIAVDHGLGLTSFYGQLERALVRKGENISMGQKIGIAGGSGLVRGSRLYFQMRVQGTPVDPREWWDKSWYYTQITSKINEAKRVSGISVYQSLN